MTKTQIATVVLIIAYLIYEFVLVPRWAAQEGGPIIRVDLFIIIPILLILAVISIFQWMRARR